MAYVEDVGKNAQEPRSSEGSKDDDEISVQRSSMKYEWIDREWVSYPVGRPAST